MDQILAFVNYLQFRLVLQASHSIIGLTVAWSGLCPITILIPSPSSHLSFGEVERLGELFALLADHVVIVLEGVLQLEQLAGGERRPDPLRLPEGLQQERRELGPCERRITTVRYPGTPSTCALPTDKSSGWTLGNIFESDPANRGEQWLDTP